MGQRLFERAPGTFGMPHRQPGHVSSASRARLPSMSTRMSTRMSTPRRLCDESSRFRPTSDHVPTIPAVLRSRAGLRSGRPESDAPGGMDSACGRDQWQTRWSRAYPGQGDARTRRCGAGRRGGTSADMREGSEWPVPEAASPGRGVSSAFRFRRPRSPDAARSPPACRARSRCCAGC
jgi:hypothetical protein